MSIQRDARERFIAMTILPGLTNDELRVLEVIGLRMLRIGRDKYGPLDLSRETRDWQVEAAAELADRLFYDACHVVAKTDERLERIQCETHDAVEPALDELRDSAPELPPVPSFDVGGES